MRRCEVAPNWFNWFRWIAPNRTQSHPDLNETTLPAQSPGVVLNGVFEDLQGRWKQGETSLGTKATCGLVLVIQVPPKQGFSHTLSSLVHSRFNFVE